MSRHSEGKNAIDNFNQIIHVALASRGRKK